MSDADRRRIHGNDERIPLNAFTEGLHLLWDVVYEFTRAQ